MSDVTQVLQAIGRGDGRASDELLPLVTPFSSATALAREKQTAARSRQLVRWVMPVVFFALSLPTLASW